MFSPSQMESWENWVKERSRMDETEFTIWTFHPEKDWIGKVFKQELKEGPLYHAAMGLLDRVMRLEALEEKGAAAGAMETKPSSPATETQADPNSGRSTSSQTFSLAKAGFPGVIVITATAMCPAPNFTLTVGDVLSHLQADGWMVIPHMTWESESPSGLTHSSAAEVTQAEPEAGRSAGGEDSRPVSHETGDAWPSTRGDEKPWVG